MRGRVPEIALALGALVVAAVTAAVAADIQTVALDEALHKQQAVRYLDGLPGVFFSDPYARATTRLYSLALTPVFGLVEGDVAIRVARAWSAVLFCSAALPAFLLAREAGVPRRLAALAGLLSIALPWAALTTVLYTENLAYPLFLWAAWAAARALRAPSAARDVLAIALLVACVYARTQLVVLLAAYAVLVAVALLGGGGRRALRRFPATAALVVLAALVLAASVLAAGPGSLLDTVLGPYRGVTQRGLPGDLTLVLAVEAAAMLIGLGIVPAVLGAAWSARTAARRAHPAHWVALTGVVFAAVVWASAAFAQGGFLGPSTEERYFFYAAPLLWIGALAALHEGTSSPRAILVGTALAAVAAALLPLVVGFNPETQFLAPVLATSGHVTARLGEQGGSGPGPHDLLVLLTVVVGATSALAWRRPRLRWAALLVLPVAVQLAATGYVLSAAARGVADVPSRSGDDFAGLGWADRAAEGRMTYLRGSRTAELDAPLAFWNSDVRTVLEPLAVLPAKPYPMSMLPSARAEVATDGTLAARNLQASVVQEPGSPFLQATGRRRATSPDGALELVRLGERPRIRWVTTGLEFDAYVGARVPLFVVPPHPGRAAAVELTFAPVPGAATELAVTLGRAGQRVRLPAAPAPPPVTVRLRTCRAQTGAIAPRVTAPLAPPDARRVAARLVQVAVRPLPDRCPPATPTRLRGR